MPVVLACAVALGIAAAIQNDFWRSKGPLGGAFQYEDTRLRRPIDPSLVTYRELTAIQTGLRDVHALACGDDGRIYVGGDHEVRTFDIAGKQVSRVVFAGRQPQCVAPGSGGSLYVGLKDRLAVVRGGNTVLWEPLGGKANITSLAVDARDVFVADAGNRVVLRFDPQGKLLGRIGQSDKEKDIPGFVIPSPHFDLAIAPDGLLRVANPGRHRIEAYTFDGDLEFYWGKPSLGVEGFSGCCNPSAFAIFPDGRVVTAEKGELVTVKIFRSDGANSGGALQCVVAGPMSFKDLSKDASAAPDVAVDAGQRVLVLDPSLRTVRVFVPIGKTGASASAPGGRT